MLETKLAEQANCFQLGNGGGEGREGGSAERESDACKPMQNAPLNVSLHPRVPVPPEQKRNEVGKQSGTKRSPRMDLKDDVATGTAVRSLTCCFFFSPLQL